MRPFEIPRGAREHARYVLRVAPHERAHWAALRGFVTVGFAAGALALEGRGDLSLFAVFGAFTCLYGRKLTHAARFTMQWRAALVFCVAVALGAAVGHAPARATLAIPLAAAVAAAVAWWAERHDWSPPGSTFVVFAFAATSALPMTPRLALEAIAVCAATAALSVGVGQVGRAAARWHRFRKGPDAPYPLTGYPSGRPVAGLHLARYAVAVILAGSAATLAGLGHPYWAMISAVVPLNVLDLHHQLARGIQRLLGTLLGVGLAGLVLSSGVRGLAAAVALALLFGLMELTMARNYGLSMVFLTPLALLQGTLMESAELPNLLRERAVESLVGVCLGMLTAWLLRSRGAGRRAPG
ncbi:FUSC family protein [Micrococcales bacterium 31B]|nr:FUSC family protein [Micrococcales bacterium 31B]